ncbi:hypothetical protein [Amycolatopsis sp. lyj-109]
MSVQCRARMRAAAGTIAAPATSAPMPGRSQGAGLQATVTYCAAR